MQQERRIRTVVWTAWIVMSVLRIALAAQLPLFVDEAFYWQESRHLDWAYSDLPGLTAWLIYLGTLVAGDHLLGVRWPFLVMGSALPWLMFWAARPFGHERAWQVCLLVTLFPLSGLLGILALPDVPMNLAAAACLLGGVWAVRESYGRAAAWLALGLVLGGLSHYRFLGVIAVGFAALLWLPQGRRALRQPRIWLAIVLGLLAWLPLAMWNFDHGEAGWKFQLLDRHPWQFQVEGFRFLVVQASVATPLMFAALLLAAMRFSSRYIPFERWFALCGGLTVLGYFLLGFVADSQRVSFHWPLPGYLALLVLVPTVVAPWSDWLRRACYALLLAGLVAAIAAISMVASDKGRARLTGSANYPQNFAGWDVLSQAVRLRLAGMPPQTRLIADHFKIGAELGFALENSDIAVLDHPLNQHHGRARQLALWGLTQATADVDSWRLLVVGASDVKLSARLAHYQSLCQRLGALPTPEVVEIDSGARRFLLFSLPPGRDDGPCITPVIAHVDEPLAGTAVERRFSVRGWATKDVAGIERVVVLLDGQPLLDADYGASNQWVGDFLRGQSRDPNLPKLQFEAIVVVPDELKPGRHVLGLEFHSSDGSVERRSGPIITLRE